MTPTATDAAVAFARWIDSMGGWVFDNSPSFYAAEMDARSTLLVAGHIALGVRDRCATLELTDAGRAWLAGLED